MHGVVLRLRGDAYKQTSRGEFSSNRKRTRNMAATQLNDRPVRKGGNK
jgi:hypothetical protein